MSKKSAEFSYWSTADVKLREPDDWDLGHCSRFPLEIASGAIDPSGVHKDIFRVQANTFEGLWDFHSTPQGVVDADELREFLQDMERRHRIPPVRWTTRTPTIVIRAQGCSVEVATAREMPIKAGVQEDATSLDDWRMSPTEILARLVEPATPIDETFDAILFAEVMPFDDSQKKELLPRLFSFIQDYRFSSKDSEKTTVGAAIRKLAMNLQESQFDAYSDLFLPTDTETLPCEIELELAKAILWRLADAESLPDGDKLGIRLTELAVDYLRPRLILQKNYASVALHAALGVLLLRGDHAESVVGSVKNLDVPWFAELFLRRLRRLRDKRGQVGDANSVATLEHFELLLNQKCNEGKTTACQLGD